MPETLLEVRGPMPASALATLGSHTVTLGELQDRSDLAETNFAKKGFNTLLLESVDEVLTDLLGAKVRRATYASLEKNCGLTRNEIPERWDDFSSSLEKLFGVGGRTIGKVVAKRLFSKLGLEFRDKLGYRFPDYVKEAKATFSE